MYNLIVATNLSNGIGLCDSNTNSIPWKSNSEDLKYFKFKTTNQIVIMGRKTWLSLPKRPLPNRINVILTSKPDSLSLGVYDRCLAFESISECDMYLNDRYPDLERWVIGGEAIYNAYMESDMISDIFVSEFNNDAQCNRFFNWIRDGLYGFHLLSTIYESQSNEFQIKHYRRA